MVQVPVPGPEIAVSDSGCASADLLLALVNTRANENGRAESLADRAALAQWLAGVRLLPAEASAAVGNADALAAQELREALVTLFRAHCNCADAVVPEAEEYLARFAERYPLVPRITATGYTLVPAQTGVPGAFGALLAAATDVASQGLWGRLKVCKNSSCWSGFFDKTRNGSGLHCSTACSSQMSMRAYRNRLKGAAVSPGEKHSG